MLMLTTERPKSRMLIEKHLETIKLKIGRSQVELLDEYCTDMNMVPAHLVAKLIRHYFCQSKRDRERILRNY